ncbi:MAG: hypothetical protein RIF41_40860 [Polyangiaceae bacterium]
MPRALTHSLRSVALALVVLATMTSFDARAQDTGSAIAFAEEGEQAFAAGDYDKAFEAFEQANRLLPAPTVVVRMADCKRQLGELVEARDLYRWASAWQLGDPPPPPWEEAKSRAARELAAVEPRIGGLRVVVRDAPGPVTVWLDGVVVPIEELDEVEVDPGDHVVLAQSEGRTDEGSIVVEEGEFGTIELDLGADGPPRFNTPSVIAYAAGGTALIVAAATGAAAMASVSDLKSRCTPDDRCPAADRDQADTAQLLADTSTATFILAGIGIGLGIGLMWLPEDDEPDVALRLDVTPRGATATLSF